MSGATNFFHLQSKESNVAITEFHTRHIPDCWEYGVHSPEKSKTNCAELLRRSDDVFNVNSAQFSSCFKCHILNLRNKMCWNDWKCKTLAVFLTRESGSEWITSLVMQDLWFFLQVSCSISISKSLWDKLK